MKTIKVIAHYMPWEIDLYLLNMHTLRYSLCFVDRTKYRFVYEPFLNVTSDTFCWERSRLGKDFFVERFHNGLFMANCFDVVTPHVIESGPYGCIDVNRDAVDDTTDFYMFIAPDALYHHTLLSTFATATDVLTNDYIYVNAQIAKRWDDTWDIITHESRRDHPNARETWYRVDPYSIVELVDNASQISLRDTYPYKLDGRCDMLNAALLKLIQPPAEWHGYGPYDTFMIMTLMIIKNAIPTFDFKQFNMVNQVIDDYRNHRAINDEDIQGGLTRTYQSSIVYNPNIKGRARTIVDQQMIEQSERTARAIIKSIRAKNQ
jgi:hypothetical protein